MSWLVKMRNVLRFIILSAPLLLAACGFTPLYGDHGAQGPAAREKFQQVSIASIPDRPGQILRNDLIDRLYSGGMPVDPRYVLAIAPIQEHSTGLDITVTSNETRIEMRLVTSMTLKDQATGKALMTRDLIAMASYNVFGSEFTTLVSQDNVRENAVHDLAQQIETQLALYFSHAP
jgi:LPS-assembly lipoprotein